MNKKWGINFKLTRQVALIDYQKPDKNRWIIGKDHDLLAFIGCRSWFIFLTDSLSSHLEDKFIEKRSEYFKKDLRCKHKKFSNAGKLRLS